MVVYCLRFRSKKRGIVTALERQKPDFLILQMTQRASFVERSTKLEDNTGEKVKRDLAKLSPFVDSENTIQLKCRLSKAAISDDLKYSILLSAKHLTVAVMFI